MKPPPPDEERETSQAADSDLGYFSSSDEESDHSELSDGEVPSSASDQDTLSNDESVEDEQMPDTSRLNITVNILPGDEANEQGTSLESSTNTGNAASVMGIPIQGALLSSQGRQHAAEASRTGRNESQPTQQASGVNEPEILIEEGTNTSSTSRIPAAHLGNQFGRENDETSTREFGNPPGQLCVYIPPRNIFLDQVRSAAGVCLPPSYEPQFMAASLPLFRPRFRLCTISVSTSGSFYLDNSDRKQCFPCGGVLRNWTCDDVVDVDHRFSAHGTDQTNSFSEPEIIYRIATAAPSGEPEDPNPNQIPGLQHMFPCSDPVNPHMRNETRRLETFDQRWPGNIRATPAQISRAGFFYLGERDRVKCWYCNGGLQNWDFDDEPWTEHAKWFPSCEFLLQRKGPDYVRAITAAFPNLRRPVLQQRPYDNQHLSHPIIDLQEDTMGGLLPQQRLLNISAPELHDPVNPPSPLNVEGETQTTHQKEQAAMLNKATKEAFAMGFDEHEIRWAQRTRIVLQGSAFEDTEALVDALKRPIKNRSLPQSSAGGGLDPSGPSDKPQKQTPSASTTVLEKERLIADLRKAKEELQKLQDEHNREQRCKVCLEKISEIVFDPCGHLCCCLACGDGLKKCPVCRKKIRKFVRVYPA